MSTVDKMLIKGIRSFDPENRNVITFFKPLTLIVGPNGAGKTTIIECLKLSCTGELPPNARSGHSFIHDPKVAGETETKGQIKLRFNTAAGKVVVCIRSFQLTQKASKMEYKAIESVLQTINPHTGEKVCLSYRCADMDREIPALMGVSKAILENVIFVHQDEANWPLQDPSTLKKKFDDIFSATRYTKALEVIKKLHKDQAQEIKTYKLKLENLHVLKDAAYKLRESLSQDQEKTNCLTRQMKDLEDSIEKLEHNISSNEAVLKDLRKLRDQISVKTAERSTLFREQQRQYAALEEENEDSDEELNEWKVKFEEKINILETRIGKLNRDMTDTNTKSSFLKQSINDCIRDISRLQTEREAFISLKNERNCSLQKLCTKYNVGSFPSSSISDADAMRLTNEMKAKLTTLKADLKEKKVSIDREVKWSENHYWEINDKWKYMEAQKKAKLEIKNSISARILEKECERSSYEDQISQVNLSLIDEREKNMRIEVEKKSKELDERAFDSNIRHKQSELYGLDQQMKTLNREKDIIASDSEDRVKLSLRKTELENIKKRHKKIIEDHKDRIREVLKGRLPTDKDLKKEVTQTLRTLISEYDDLSAKGREAEKKVNVTQMKIQELNNSLSKFRKDTESRKSFIESKLHALDQSYETIDSYLKVLDIAKEKRDIQKSKYNIADGMRQMFDPFERVARSHHICPCCERPFSPEEEDDFVKKQRVKAASSAEHMKVLAMESSTAEDFFQQVDRLRIAYDEYLKIGKESIPSTEKTLMELKIEISHESQSLDDLLGVLAQVKIDKESIESLMPHVETADRLLQESLSLQKQVDELDYKLDFRGKGVKSIEEIQSELKFLQNRRDDLQTDLEKLREDQRYLETDLTNVQLRWHTLREEKATAGNILTGFKKTEEELEKLIEQKNEVELDQTHLEESAAPLLKEREKLQTDHELLKCKLEHEYEEGRKHVDECHQEVDVLLKLNGKIKEYNDLKKGERLEEVQEKLSLSESELQNCEAKKEEFLTEVSKCKEAINSQDRLRRNIEDNLNYRKTKADVDKLAQEIESLEEKILSIGGIASFESELAKLSQEKERQLSEFNKIRGTVAVHQSNISKYMGDLKQAQYKDIEKRYFDQFIQLKTTEMANKDLDRYYTALDKALMRFHTIKMEEINKIIRELWQQTYRGQDIDYISIHSDSEGTGARSYSYKVLMQTGDAELEMRGRCSAGQKVLASIIIRLALAETFCLNCGILALDEPTTNLDGPNAESLAAALLRIMEDRKGQENFQLIVITHDERFAQMIGQRQHAERYYRVSKDDHQHSIIEAQEIFE